MSDVHAVQALHFTACMDLECVLTRSTSCAPCRIMVSVVVPAGVSSSVEGAALRLTYLSIRLSDRANRRMCLSWMTSNREARHSAKAAEVLTTHRQAERHHRDRRGKRGPTSRGYAMVSGVRALRVGKHSPSLHFCRCSHDARTLPPSASATCSHSYH